jgi:hypothetical protein
VYLPEGATLEEAIFEGDPEVTLADKKLKTLVMNK